jgi:hypothetical protein
MIIINFAGKSMIEKNAGINILFKARQLRKTFIKSKQGYSVKIA